MSLNVLESQRNGEYKKGTVDLKPNSEHDCQYHRTDVLRKRCCTICAQMLVVGTQRHTTVPSFYPSFTYSCCAHDAQWWRTHCGPVGCLWGGLFNCKPNPYKRPYTSSYNAIQYNLPNVWVAVGNDQLSGMLESWAQLFITWSSCVLIYRRFSFFEMKHAWEFKVNPTLL